MRVQLSLPTDQPFFNRYATLIPTLSTLGVIAQIISFLTEVGIIYNIVLSRVSEFFPNYGQLIATITAIIGAAFLEIGLRKFAPYSVRAFLYERKKGLDFAMSVFILLCFTCLLISCGVLSFKGSKEWVNIAAASPKLETTDKTDLDYLNKKKDIKAIFSSDSLMIVSNCTKQIKAETNLYNAKIKKQESDLRRYERRELRTGFSFKTKKESIRGKIALLETQKADKINSLESAKTANLKTLSIQRRFDNQKVDSTYYAELGLITMNNDKAVNKSQATTDFYGNGLAWFTIICLAVFLFSVTIEEIHKKGSGIESVAIPNQYYFSQSVLSEFINTVSEKVNYELRNKINTWAKATPPPPLPKTINSLYDLSQLKQQRIVLVGENLSKESGKGKTKALKVEQLDGTIKTIVRKSYNDTTESNKRVCVHCGTTYNYRHHKQKYCKDECRIAAWEQRTGKKLKLKKKKE